MSHSAYRSATLIKTTMAKRKAKQKAKPEQIRFLKSPTGTYNLAYSVNDIIPASTLGKTKCDELVVAGYAEYTK